MTMCITVIPTEPIQKTKQFTRIRTGQSDYQLLIELLDIVSNSILFTDMLSMKPIYDASGLALEVTYLSY
jgi:hypothetical protein